MFASSYLVKLEVTVGTQMFAMSYLVKREVTVAT